MSDPTTTTSRHAGPARAGEDHDPDSPADLPPASRKEILKRTWREFREDDVTDWAAALTYYAVLSIFPAFLVLISLVGLAGRETTDTVLENLNAVTPGPGREIVTSAVENIQGQDGAALGALLAGIAGALWSASGYVGAFSRASNAIWEVEEGRPFYKLRPQQLAVTALLLLLISVSAISVVLTGGIAEQVGNVVGVGSTAVDVWDIAKWPVLVVVVGVMLAILYWSSPNAKQPGIRWVSPGGMVAVVLWIVISALFSLYVASFASYNETYGSLGGVIAFLVWLWLTNIAFLFGAEVNAEITRARQIERGQPEDLEPIMPPRDTRTFDDEEKARTAAQAPLRPADHQGR